jgi:hypothetical protein
LRGGEGEGEELGAAGGGDLTEEAGSGTARKPGDTAGPDGMAFEAGVDHRELEPVRGVSSLGAGEGVVCAGEEKGAAPEMGEAGIGDLVGDGLPVGVGEVGSEGLGEDKGLGEAWCVGGAEVGAVDEIG